MANPLDQAGAIWKALDEMMEKDPEGYQRFIKEQMHEAQYFFKSQRGQSGSKQEKGQGESRLGVGLEQQGPRGKVAAGALGMESLFGQFSQLGINNNARSKTNVPTPSKSQNLAGAKKQTGIQTAELNSNRTNEQEPSGSGPKTCLLDNSIGNSIITSIVTDDTLLRDEKNSEEDGQSLVDIILPSDFTTPKDVGMSKGSKPLIQEL